MPSTVELNISLRTLRSFAFVSPSLVSAFYLQPPNARAISRGGGGASQTEKMRTILTSKCLIGRRILTNIRVGQ